MQPAADKASMTCSHLAIYLATYLSSLPSSHPCINLTLSLSLSQSPCPHLYIYVAMRNLSVHPCTHVIQPDKASMTCSHLAIYLATYLSSLPSSHPCINLTFSLSLSLSCSLSLSLSFSMPPPSLHLRSYAKLTANNSCYHVVLLALFGNLSPDLFMHPSTNYLSIYLSVCLSI